MAYDNLAVVVIQALSYVTIMGFDVLLFVILDALANPNKERVKEDGVNTSDWLLSKCFHSVCASGADFSKRSGILHWNAIPSILLRYLAYVEVHCPSVA